MLVTRIAYISQCLKKLFPFTFHFKLTIPLAVFVSSIKMRETFDENRDLRFQLK